MNPKIIQAINTMITRKDLITDIVLENSMQEEEFYFKFKDYRWSIRRDSSDYYLHFYPGKGDIKEVISDPAEPGGGQPIVTYSTKDYKSKEAVESFRALYQLIQEGLYGIDKMLDDILGEDDGLPF